MKFLLVYMDDIIVFSTSRRKTSSGDPHKGTQSIKKKHNFCSALNFTTTKISYSRREKNQSSQQEHKTHPRYSFNERSKHVRIFLSENQGANEMFIFAKLQKSWTNVGARFGRPSMHASIIKLVKNFRSFTMTIDEVSQMTETVIVS